jgi:hypothetical protein
MLGNNMRSFISGSRSLPLRGCRSLLEAESLHPGPIGTSTSCPLGLGLLLNVEILWDVSAHAIANSVCELTSENAGAKPSKLTTHLDFVFTSSPPATSSIIPRISLLSSASSAHGEESPAQPGYTQQLDICDNVEREGVYAHDKLGLDLSGAHEDSSADSLSEDDSDSDDSDDDEDFDDDGDSYNDEDSDHEGDLDDDNPDDAHFTMDTDACMYT